MPSLLEVPIEYAHSNTEYVIFKFNISIRMTDSLNVKSNFFHLPVISTIRSGHRVQHCMCRGEVNGRRAFFISPGCSVAFDFNFNV